MHQSINKENWNNVKGEIQKTFKLVSSNELEKTRGDFSAVSSLIQRKMHIQPEEADRRLDDLISRCGTKADISDFNKQSQNRPHHK